MSFDSVGTYIKLLLGKIFSIWGVITTASSFALFFFGNGILPTTFPAFFLGTMLILVMLIVCGGLVWSDQLKLTMNAKTELANFKESMPIFSLSEVTVVKYSIKPIIEKYKQMLVALEPEEVEVMPAQEIQTGKPVSNSLSILNTDFLSSISSIKKMSEAFTSQLHGSPFHNMVNAESREDKYARIKKHIIQLERYEQNLGSTYKLSLSFLSSRFASNIEVSLVSDNSSNIVLSSDFIRGNIPYTSEPQKDTSFAPVLSYYPESYQNIYESYIKADRAYAGLTKFVNASTPEPIFDQNLYVINENKKINIEIEFISKELIKPQIIQHAIDANIATTILVRE